MQEEKPNPRFYARFVCFQILHSYVCLGMNAVQLHGTGIEFCAKCKK